MSAVISTARASGVVDPTRQLSGQSTTRSLSAISPLSILPTPPLLSRHGPFICQPQLRCNPLSALNLKLTFFTHSDSR